MKNIKYLLMAVVSFIVINVWFFRFNKPTIYRGGSAVNMIEEFSAYGLSEPFVYIIGGLKVMAAIGLLIGLYFKKAILPSSLLMAVLMLGAISMHFKINDALIKFFPAALMFTLSLGIILMDRKKEFS